jgi:threonine aldolase
MIDRLQEDHDSARALASALARIPLFDLDPAKVRTNIIVAGTRGITAPELSRRLQDVGVLTTVFGPHRIRFVTHYGITHEDVVEAAERIERVAAVLV